MAELNLAIRLPALLAYVLMTEESTSINHVATRKIALGRIDQLYLKNNRSILPILQFNIANLASVSGVQLIVRFHLKKDSEVIYEEYVQQNPRPKMKFSGKTLIEKQRWNQIVGNWTLVAGLSYVETSRLPIGERERRQYLARLQYTQIAQREWTVVAEIAAPTPAPQPERRLDEFGQATGRYRLQGDQLFNPDDI